MASRASDMARVPEVHARIKELSAAVADAAVWDMAKVRDAVLQDAWDVLHADTSDLITHRRLNCRFCHGQGHAYRWRDETEFWAELARVSAVIEGWGQRPGRPPELPTDEGGYGWRRLHPPAADCPKCEGEGIAEPFVPDIRTLSGPARRAYAGVKIKKDGSLEVLTRDKEAARATLAKAAGLADDTLKVKGLLGVVPLPALTPEQVAAVARQLESDI